MGYRSNGAPQGRKAPIVPRPGPIRWPGLRHKHLAPSHRAGPPWAEQLQPGAPHPGARRSLQPHRGGREPGPPHGRGPGGARSRRRLQLPPEAGARHDRGPAGQPGDAPRTDVRRRSAGDRSGPLERAAAQRGAGDRSGAGAPLAGSPRDHGAAAGRRQLLPPRRRADGAGRALRRSAAGAPRGGGDGAGGGPQRHPALPGAAASGPARQ